MIQAVLNLVTLESIQKIGKLVKMTKNIGNMTKNIGNMTKIFGKATNFQNESL